MIAGSMLLVAVAVALLVGGFAKQVDVLYYGSIVASALAAFTLIVGARQVVGDQADSEDDFDLGPPAADLPLIPALAGGELPLGMTNRRISPARSASATSARARSASGGSAPGGSAPGGSSAAGVEHRLVGVASHPGPADVDEGDPPDEPSAQLVGAADGALLARLVEQVYVIDGRPRYHVNRCLHLLGRDCESLAVREAMELGFTPCAQCEPARVLVAQARRG